MDELHPIEEQLGFEDDTMNSQDLGLGDEHSPESYNDFGRGSRNKPNPSPLEQSLISIKNAVQKASEEALQRTDPSSQQVLENSDPNASFHLGMELFGSEPALIEESIQENLVKMEKDLKQVMQQITNTDSASQSNVMESSFADAGAVSEMETQVLHFRIQFLRQCSRVRQLIDEAAALSDLSAMEAQEQVDFVQAIRKLLEAEQVWEKTLEMMRQQEGENQQSAQESSSGDGDAIAEEMRKAHVMINLLREDIRNPKVEIISHVQNVWQSCITLEPETIFVRGFKSPQHRLSTSSSSFSPPPALEQAYNVMQVLFDEQQHTLLQELLLPFANRLYDEVIAPVLKSHKKPCDGVVCWEFHEMEDRGTSSLSVGTTAGGTSALSTGPVRSLEWTRDEDKTTEKDVVAGWKETFEFLKRVLVFVADYALLGRPELTQLVGKRLLGHISSSSEQGAIPYDLKLHELGLSSFRLGNDHGILMGPLTDLMADTCIPDYVNPQDLSLLRETKTRLEEVVEPWLQIMTEKGLMQNTPPMGEDGPLSSTSSSRLSKFANEFLQKYIDHRHSLKLDEARSLILNNDYHNTVQVGVDVTSIKPEDQQLGLGDGLKVFMLHQSSISSTAFELMKLCRECMDEAVGYAGAVPQSEPVALADLPATLYQAARQVLDLYRAIVPVRYGKEAAEVPRTAAIHYNDCIFLAHHCLSMGLLYRQKFASATEKSGSDGDALLQRVCIFVDKVPLFRDMADRCMRQMLDRQANEIQELVSPRIELLDKALRSEEIVAEWADAESALNAALYHLKHLAQTWKPVLSYDMFQSTIGYLSDVLFTLFADQVLKANDFSTDACQFVHQLFGKALDSVHELLSGGPAFIVDKSVRTWSRFQAIGRAMDMSLSDIEAGLSDGVFSSITGQDLTKLIQAAFDDSPQRQELLHLLHRK